MVLPFRPQISKRIGGLTGSWKNFTHVLHSFCLKMSLLNNLQVKRKSNFTKLFTFIGIVPENLSSFLNPTLDNWTSAFTQQLQHFQSWNYCNSIESELGKKTINFCQFFWRHCEKASLWNHLIWVPWVKQVHVTWNFLSRTHRYCSKIWYNKSDLVCKKRNSSLWSSVQICCTNTIVIPCKQIGHTIGLIQQLWNRVDS